MFSGYLATAAYNGLSGTNGLPGWKVRLESFALVPYVDARS
jgi:hypothetical protein